MDASGWRTTPCSSIGGADILLHVFKVIEYRLAVHNNPGDPQMGWLQRISGFGLLSL